MMDVRTGKASWVWYYCGADSRAREQEDDTCDQDAKVFNVEGSDFSHDQAGGHEESAPWKEERGPP